MHKPTLHSVFLHLALLGLVFSGPVPARANDLLDVFRQAQARDPQLEIQAQQRAAQIESRPQARAALLPQLAVTAERAHERLGPEDPAPTGDSSQVGVGITQTLWNLEAFQRLRASGFDVAEAEARFEAARQGLLLRVAEAYFHVLSAADQLATNRAAREAFGGLLNQARVREETGIGPRSAVLQAESFYDATLQPVIDAGNNYEDALRALAAISGSYRDVLAALRDDAALPPATPSPADDWLARARSTNPGLLASASHVESAEHLLSAEQASGMPTLSARGSLASLREDAALGPDSDQRRIALSLTWPLFQGGAVASRTREARARYRQAQAEYEQALRDVERQLRRSYVGSQRGSERIEAGRRLVASTQAAIEAARNNVEFGTGSEFELLNAQNLHFVALSSYHQARFDYLLDTLRLQQLAGELGERDLLRIDALLVDGSARGAANVP